MIYFIMDVNLGLAKAPLKFDGGLAKPGLLQ